MTTALNCLRQRLASGPHGTRGRYVLGCRCDDCRRANTAYARSRTKRKIFHGADPLVPVEQVESHIAALRAQGIGIPTIADAAKVPRNTLWGILGGKRQFILSSSAARILTCDMSIAADNTRIPAGPTWRILDQLLDDGYTKKQLAQWLGKKEALQLRRGYVTVRNARAVERLAADIAAGRRRRP